MTKLTKQIFILADATTGVQADTTAANNGSLRACRYVL